MDFTTDLIDKYKKQINLQVNKIREQKGAINTGIFTRERLSAKLKKQSEAQKKTIQENFDMKAELEKVWKVCSQLGITSKIKYYMEQL